MVTKRKRIALRVVAIIAFASFAWLLTRPSQPLYDGRSLTQWMAALGSADTDEEAHAFAAIEAMGTNALPTIIRFLERRDSTLKLRCLRVAQRIPFLHVRFTTAAEWRQKANVALILSGAESQHASIPALVRLSRDTDAGVRQTAVDALSQFMFTEPATLPALEAAQTDADAQVRVSAQEAVQRHRGVSNAVQRLREMRPNHALQRPAIAPLFQS